MWNFERRRIVCGTFVVGVALVTKGKADVTTSLEAVRSRVRLPPEDALFAARKLHEENLIDHQPGGAVRSSQRGIDHAESLVQAAIAGARSLDDVLRTLAGGGVALAMLRVALLARGGTLPCDEAPDTASHRLVLAEDRVVIERRDAHGDFAPLDA